MKIYQQYTVVLSFSAECCTYPHLWVQPLRARTVAEARRRAASIVRRAGAMPYETAVITGVPDYAPVEELPTSYWGNASDAPPETGTFLSLPPRRRTRSTRHRAKSRRQKIERRDE